MYGLIYLEYVQFFWSYVCINLTNSSSSLLTPYLIFQFWSISIHLSFFSQNNHVISRTRWENRKFRIISSVHPYVFAWLRPQTIKLWILLYLYLYLFIYSVAQVWCSVSCRELYASFPRLAIHFSHDEWKRTSYVYRGMNMKMELSWDKMSKGCRGCRLS